MCNLEALELLKVFVCYFSPLFVFKGRVENLFLLSSFPAKKDIFFRLVHSGTWITSFRSELQ